MSKSLEKRINWPRLRHKYLRSSPKNKSKLLNEICDLSGMNRKYLIRKFNQKTNRKLIKRGPKPTYDKDIYVPILKPIWMAADQLCSKKLKAILPIWLPYYEEENGSIEATIRKKLLLMSATTLDRILKPVKAKYKTKGRSGTKPGSLIKNQIPIKTNQWEETKPGFIEADTVAHCGNSLEGNFVWSLTMSDILTAWTENRATWNKGAHGVGEQIDDIEINFPFEMKGFDCDNGSEFLNYHLLNKFADRPKEKGLYEYLSG